MHGLQEEIDAFRARTRNSAKAFETAKRFIPFGVNSNYRLVDPYPLYIERAKGARIWDVDGNEYVDFNMAFGALVAGHSHPVMVKAIKERVANGTIFGFEAGDAAALASHLAKRFHVDRIKFSNTGLEATLFAVRLARGVTDRTKVLKFEGCYHGSHDTLMVSIKPSREKEGDPRRPNPVPSSRGLVPQLTENTVVAPFNDLGSTETLAREHADDLAAIILEPIPMNMGFVLPQPGFLEGLRRLADETGALLIFDEVKTCSKFYGGAEEAFGVTPDLKCFGKSIGGGFPLSAVGGKAAFLEETIPGRISHAGTFNANPVSITAGLVTMTKILTRAGMNRAARIGEALGRGYRELIDDHRLFMHVQYKGISGTVHFTRKPVTDWRSFQSVDVGRWWGYFMAMLNRGIIPGATGPDEQWTASVSHTSADVTRHLDAFSEVADLIKQEQPEMPLVEAV
jgi:glutamate-1-semialdehyde 2,1-aminomutase